MPRPFRETAVTSLKMTPEVRDLWEQCVQAEDRSLTNLHEVLVHARSVRVRGAGFANRLVNTDARALPFASRTRPLCASYRQRYVL